MDVYLYCLCVPLEACGSVHQSLNAMNTVPKDICKYPCVPVWHVQVFPCELQQGIQLPCMVPYMLYEHVCSHRSDTCICVASMFAMRSAASLTWQPAACSCGCAVPQDQRAVGIGTQQLPWLETPSHRHNQSPEPGVQLLLGKEGMLLGVPLKTRA